MEGLTLLSFTDPSFWFYLLYFWASVTLAWYVPGSVLVRRLGLSTLPHITLSFLVGLVAWSWQGELFGLLHIRWATYGYVFLLAGLYFFQRGRMKKLHKFTHFNATIVTVLLVGFGVALQQIPVWYTAIRTVDGLSFCCTLPINPVGQLAITNEIIRKIPPDQPGLSGQPLTNYHHWLNIAVAELVRVFRLPLLYTSSQYVPLFTSIFLGLSAIILSSLLGLSVRFVHWFLFFLYFGTDLGFIAPLVFGKGINFLMPSLLSGGTFLFNPQTAISIVLLFCAYALLLLVLKRPTPRIIVLAAFLFGTLIGFKVHTGILALIGLGTLAAYQTIRKNYTVLLVFSISLAVALVVYLPTNAGAGGLYVAGFWRIEEFAKTPQLGFDQSLLTTIAYLTKQKRLFSISLGTGVRVLLYESLFFTMFLISLVGTKLIGLFQTRKTLTHVALPVHICIGSSIVGGMVLGLFFLQTSGVGHSEYFLHVSAIGMSLYAALAIYRQRRSTVMRTLLVFVVVAGLLRYYQLTFDAVATIRNSKNHYVISNEELAALSFLRSQTPLDAVVVVDPTNRLESVVNYVSFMANRSTYLSGVWGLGALNVGYGDRLPVVGHVFTEERRDVSGVLDRAGITYVYLMLPSQRSAHLRRELPVVFENSDVAIFASPRAL